jgi:hypothetical protein
MSRRREPLGFLLAPIVVVAAILAGACGGPPEEATLQRFFRASQARDNATLMNFAVAGFEPKTDGTISNFDIVSVSEERTEPLRVKELAVAYEEIQAAEQKFTADKLVYQNANVPAINRVLKAEFDKKPVTGKDVVVQAEWNKWRTDTQQWAKKVAEARARLANSRPVPEVSLSSLPAEQVPDLTKAEGEIISKDVTINATVRLPDGKTTPKTLVITMQRARLKGATPDGLTGRWVIAGIKDTGAAKAS